MNSTISPKKPAEIAFKSKSIALGSGKGGVGKSTTAVNLAIYYARRGLRVALFDLDPLSDIATLLDLTDSEQAVSDADGDGLPDTLNGAVTSVLPNLDLVLADLKLRPGDSVRVHELIRETYLDDLVESYDMVIYDLPAGMGFEDNIVFARDVGRVIVVTNSEPTAHVAAGGYIREIITDDESGDTPTIRLWHNKYSVGDIGFDSRDVIGNYNRNVPEDERLPVPAIETNAAGAAGRVEFKDIAFIPADPSMDLLQTESSASVNVQRRLEDMIEFMHHERAASFALRVPRKIFALVQYYLARHKRIDDVAAYMARFGEYVTLLSQAGQAGSDGHGEDDSGAIEVFTPEEYRLLSGFLSAVKSDQICTVATRLLEMLERSIAAEENSTRLFFAGTPLTANKAIDRDLSLLLRGACEIESVNAPVIRNIAGVLLFYFGVYKLLQSPTILKLISDFIPMRTGSGGMKIRDKRMQIRNLVDLEGDYRRRYFALIKTVYPVVNKQIATIIKTFDLQHLLLRNSDGTVNREAYVKLMTDFVHDAVHSGLGVIAGFKHRPAASAFRAGAERLLKDLGIADTGDEHTSKRPADETQKETVPSAETVPG